MKPNIIYWIIYNFISAICSYMSTVYFSSNFADNFSEYYERLELTTIDVLNLYGTTDIVVFSLVESLLQAIIVPYTFGSRFNRLTAGAIWAFMSILGWIFGYFNRPILLMFGYMTLGLEVGIFVSAFQSIALVINGCAWRRWYYISSISIWFAFLLSYGFIIHLSQLNFSSNSNMFIQISIWSLVYSLGTGYAVKIMGVRVDQASQGE